MGRVEAGAVRRKSHLELPAGNLKMRLLVMLFSHSRGVEVSYHHPTAYLAEAHLPEQFLGYIFAH